MKLKTIRYALEDGIAVITFDEENSPVNTMCLQWQDDLDAVAAQVVKDKDASAASSWPRPRAPSLPAPTSRA
jgi:hypothetical protein